MVENKLKTKISFLKKKRNPKFFSHSTRRKKIFKVTLIKLKKLKKQMYKFRFSSQLAAMKAQKRLEKIYYKHIYQINVLSTPNNTHITLMNYNTKYVIAKANAGAAGYKKLQKPTRFAATQTLLKIIRLARYRGIIFVIVKFKGRGRNKKHLKTLLKKNFKVLYYIDNNRYRHNGCKIRKAPRK